MNFDEIADRIADEADDFLAGVHNRVRARAGVEEMVTIRHADIPPAQRAEIATRVMGILEREGFFDAAAGGEDSDSGGEPDERDA